MEITTRPKPWWSNMLCGRGPKGVLGGCGCRFKIEGADVQYRDDNADAPFYVPCPVCGLTVTVTKELRKDVRLSAERRFRASKGASTAEDRVALATLAAVSAQEGQVK